MYNSYLDYYKSSVGTAFKAPHKRTPSEPDTDHAPGEDLYHEDVAVDEAIADALQRQPTAVVFAAADADTVSLSSLGDTESKAPTAELRPSSYKLKQASLAPPGATFKGGRRSAGEGTHISVLRKVSHRCPIFL